MATEAPATVSSGRYVRRRIGKHFARIGLILLTVIVAAAIMLYSMLYLACHGPSEATKQLFVTTILETGALKWTARLVMTEEEIEAVMQANTMQEMDVTIDESLITIAADAGETDAADEVQAEPFDINGVEIVKIAGRTYDATLMIVSDPSRVFCATTAPTWHRRDLSEIVADFDALGGINGGLYDQTAATPMNVAVSQGEIVYNEGSYKDLYLIGFDTDNFLRIISLGNGTRVHVREIVEENHIRDAVVFPDWNGANNAHFVTLVINGEARETNGMGSGANPRTAIGQRADGSVLLLVTDGRGTNGHLGATAQDLIDIMVEYGAVNAANLDGGSSSAMYYDGDWLMTSTTLYYSNTSYKLPTAFLVERRDGNE